MVCRQDYYTCKDVYKKWYEKYHGTKAKNIYALFNFTIRTSFMG